MDSVSSNVDQFHEGSYYTDTPGQGDTGPVHPKNHSFTHSFYGTWISFHSTTTPLFGTYFLK